MDQMITAVTELKVGQTGAIVAIEGGFGMVRRLDALGIHEGTKITKVSGQWMRGPVVVRIGSADIAIGYGMARRIVVALTAEAPE